MKLSHPIDYDAIPAHSRVFHECGQCGSLHHRDLPGNIDCRDDAHRFTFDELDERYGRDNWTYWSLEDAENAEPGDAPNPPS